MLVGIDALETVRMENLINNNFLGRHFTEYEKKYILGRSSETISMAGIFCAKEAFLKALGIGLFNGIDLNEIEVCHKESGKPFLNLSENAKRHMKLKGVSSVEISITHTHTLSTAICILN